MDGGNLESGNAEWTRREGYWHETGLLDVHAGRGGETGMRGCACIEAGSLRSDQIRSDNDWTLESWLFGFLDCDLTCEIAGVCWFGMPWWGNDMARLNAE